MSAPAALPGPDALRTLLERGAPDHALQIWRPAEGDRPASVLVPLLTGDGELRILLTRRSPDLSKHAGEYSFPGGRPEPDDRDALHTALRETHEEVGIPASMIEVVGTLPMTTTYVTGYAITPFVGVIEAAPEWVAQDTEVSEVAEPRLVDLVAAREVHRVRRGDGETLEMPVFPLGPDRAVWGATARILDELLVRLAPIVGAFPHNPEDATRPVRVLGR